MVLLRSMLTLSMTSCLICLFDHLTRARHAIVRQTKRFERNVGHLIMSSCQGATLRLATRYTTPRIDCDSDLEYENRPKQVEPQRSGKSGYSNNRSVE
jgi:hypothetical protein